MHTDPYVPVQCELIGTQNDPTLLVPVHGRPPLVYNLALLQEGTYNRVYTIRTAAGPIQDVVFRLAKVSKGTVLDRYNKHQQELLTGVRLAEQGICPKIFMNLAASMVVTEQSEQYITFGTAIERYDCSLADVQLCPILMRQVFVEGNGESLLIDLYARVSSTTMCIDTRPANVVVRLPDASRGISLALIDVDPGFCFAYNHPVPYVPRGLSPLHELDLVLYDLGEKNLSESALLVAAMSLIIHVTASALDYIVFKRGFGFPYIEITLVLMRNWNKVWSMLHDDDKMVSGRYMLKETSVIRVILSHWSPAAVKGNFDLSKLSDRSDPDQLYMFLASMVVCRESRILRACTKQRRPDLYRNIIVLTIRDTREQYKSKLVALVKSESIEAWDAMVAGTVPLSDTQCGMKYCTFHRDVMVAAQGFGGIRRTKKEKKEENRMPRNAKMIKTKQ
jgi:hypothetical protein